MPTINDLNHLLSLLNKTLGSVESYTGGLFASRITSISGASKFFKGGLVTYASEIKEKVLGIDRRLIEQYGVVSKEIAQAMATKGKNILDVDYCVSFTGNAGPLALENKEVGEVYIGISYQNLCKVIKLKLEGDRDDVRSQSVEIAVNELIKIIKQENNI